MNSRLVMTIRLNIIVDKFSYGVAQLAAAFYPHDVLLRFSDFKSNEYANLIGGKFMSL